MTRRSIALALALPLAVTAWLAPPAGAAVDGAPVGSDRVRSHHRSHPQALPVIHGEVGPSFTISMDQDSVPAGRYKFVIQDRSSSHNFHLTGQGVDESTTVRFVGKEVWRLRLRPGSYRAQCDPHASMMNTTLQVTAA